MLKDCKLSHIDISYHRDFRVSAIHHKLTPPLYSWSISAKNIGCYNASEAIISDLAMARLEELNCSSSIVDKPKRMW